MSDGNDLVQLGTHPVEQLHQIGQCLGMIGESVLVLQRLTAIGVGDQALAVTDALDQTAGHHLLRVGVNHLVFDGTGAAVQQQDRSRHASPLFSDCAWMAVIATVFTMSSINAPRERSLTGLLSPCSTGPIATAPADLCTAL